MKESITHLEAFITELVNEAVQTALVQHQESASTALAEINKMQKCSMPIRLRNSCILPNKPCTP
jgi:hypothetical protein